jgi:CHASE3 domain sensor protein
MRLRLPKHLRKTAIGLSLMLIPLSLLGVHLLLQNEFGTARELRRTVTETVETRRLLSELLTLHLDMETGMRGYVLSGNEVFLEPYNRSYRRRGELLARLEPHLASDPGSAELLADIVRNSNAKLAFTREGVEMARAGQRDAAIAPRVRDDAGWTRSGSRSMNSMRSKSAISTRWCATIRV